MSLLYSDVYCICLMCEFFTDVIRVIAGDFSF